MPLKKVIEDFGRAVWPSSGSKKNHKKSKALFYRGSEEALHGRHIYYEPPENFEWSASSGISPGKQQNRNSGDFNPSDCSGKFTQETSSKKKKAYTKEEFTSAILARTHHQPGNLTERKDDILKDDDDIGANNNYSTMSNTDDDFLRECDNSAGHVTDPNFEDASLERTRVLSLSASETSNQESPALHRRNKGVLDRLKSLANRTSYSPSEDGYSHSSDYEEPEETKSEDRGLHRGAKERSSSWAGRVRHLHRDVKRKISKMRNSKAGSNPEEQKKDSHENAEIRNDIGSSEESIPCGSRSSLQVPTPTSSNRSSTSAGEDETSAFVGTFIGRARALVDYTPSPYDRDGLAFKKGDTISIIAKHKTGIWVGMVQGKIGHFKFINVEEIVEEVKSGNKAQRKNTTNWLYNCRKPKTMEQLLKQIGLQEYMNVLVLNGYGDLETFKEVEKEDLDDLGIVNPEHGQKLLKAIEMLQGSETEVEEKEDQIVQSPRDSGCYASHEHLPQKDSNFSENQKCETEGDTLVLTNNLDLSAESSTVSTTTTTGSREDNTLTTEGKNNHTEKNCFNILPSEQTEDETVANSEATVDYEPSTTNNKSDFQEPTDLPFVTATSFARSITTEVSPGRHFHRNLNSKSIASENCMSLPNIPTTLSDNKELTGIQSSVESSGDQCESRTLPKQKESTETYMSRLSYLNYTYLNSTEVTPTVLESASHSKKKSSNRARRRKGSLQEAVQSKECLPLAALVVVKEKLEKEAIHLFEEPYTDKTGFCGIPPALVQRYALELQQNLTEVANAMDQIRISALQQQARRGVPNDFLAETCLSPVIETNYTCIESWLTSLGLPMYKRHFAQIGCDDLEQIMNLSLPNLDALGVEDASHEHFLQVAIHALQCRFNMESNSQEQEVLTNISNVA